MRLKRIGCALLALVMVLGMAGCGGNSKDTAVAKVGDVELTEGQLDQYMELNAYLAGYDLSSITDDASKVQIKQLMLKQLISEELARQYVESTGKDVLGEDYDNNLKKFLESVKDSVGEDLKKMEITDETLTYFYNSQAYGQALYEEVKAGITDIEKEKLAYYEAHPDTYTSKDLQLSACHILVEKEEDAKAIKAELDQGGDFAAIAKEKSIDPGSGAKGGDVGTFKEGDMVGEFWKGAKALEVGQISEPIKSQFGYHIIKLTDKKEPGLSPYEEVQPQVEEAVVNEAYQKKMTEIEKNTGVEYLDKDLEMKATSGDEKK